MQGIDELQFLHQSGVQSSKLSSTSASTRAWRRQQHPSIPKRAFSNEKAARFRIACKW
jgi:hypothetical protein